ncbi:hypothetical protein ACQP2X_34920 [Actinoplanes sp. CA-131856]
MSFSKRRVIMAALAMLLGGSLIAVFVKGSGGLEVASWIAAIVGLVVALTAIPQDGALNLEKATVQRFVRTSLSVVLAVGTFLVCAGDTASRTSLGAVVGASLMFEASGPVVVFGRASDGVGYCSRPDQDWKSRWHGPNVSPNWRRLDDLTAFASSYRGLEVIGRRGDRLFFGYRDGDLAWYPLKLVGDGVRGQPAAMEDDASPGKLRFLAFAPAESGGVKIFERTDYKDSWPFPWYERSTLVPEVGAVDGVAVGKDRNGSLVLLLRSGSKLLETHRAPTPVSADIGRGWSKPRPLRITAGTVPAPAGNPTPAAVDDISTTSALRFAVPAVDGVALLSTPDIAKGWTVETVPLSSPPTAAARLDTTNDDGYRTTVVVFVRNKILEQVWRDEKTTWSAPAPVSC